ILPFYIKTFLDLRALRVFRIFRIFRIFKLVRYNKALRRFHIAYNLIKEELVLFLMLTSIFLFIASAGIYYFEHKAQPEYFSSVVDSGWWAAVTLTTVGYGDVYPITAGGKIFTLFILLLGVGIITIPAGLIASALSKARKMEEENLKN
ncbi:MAG: ion transporter, partial [Bacteroidetes bacterium]|nr:ion transporter [Bacteroidota bacterium]